MKAIQVLKRYKLGDMKPLCIAENSSIGSGRHIALARFGENHVADSLKEKGWRIVARNWRAGRYAELDLVAKDPGGMLVFIEVKTRLSGPGQRTNCTGLDSINWRKQRKIVTSARLFMARYCVNDDCRFDVFIVNAYQPQGYDEQRRPAETEVHAVTHVVDAFSLT